MRVVILTSDDAHHSCLISLLGSKFDIRGLVVEPGSEQLRRLRRLGRWSDYFWRLYNKARRDLCGLTRYRRRFFGPLTDQSVLARYPVIRAAWINDSSVHDRVRAWRPDVVIVCGTSILRPCLLRDCGPVVLNVHGGHLPDYRGNHCFFFALYERAFDKIGSTIHFVDPGVDTGDIVAVARPDIRPSDDAERLYCRAEWLAFLRLCDLLQRFQDGIPLPRRRQPDGGRTFRMRDRKPWHDLVWELGRRLGLIELPRIPHEGADELVGGKIHTF